MNKSFYEEIMEQGFMFSKLEDTILLRKISTNKNQSVNICDKSAPVYQMMFDNKKNAENFVKKIIGWTDQEIEHVVPISEVQKILQEKEKKYEEACAIILDLKQKIKEQEQDIKIEQPQPQPQPSQTQLLEYKEYDSYIMFDIGLGAISYNLGTIKHYSPEEAKKIADGRAIKFFQETYPQEIYENVPKKINIRLN